MGAETLFELIFAAAVVLAGAALVGAALERLSVWVLRALIALLALAATAAWTAFAVEPGEELAVSAGGLVAALAAAFGALGLRRGLARSRRTEAELDRAEAHLRDVVEREAAARAAELERLIARTRADSLSRLQEEERRLAEERRRAFAEREREAGSEIAAALAAAQRRVEQRLAGWAVDLDRAQARLASELERLETNQRRLIAEAEARLRADADRLEGMSAENRAALAQVRAEVERSARDAAAAATAELDSHGAERRRALHEVGERLRQRERELTEQIGREATEAASRVQAGFAEVERRQVEALERVVAQAAGRAAEAAAHQFDASIKTAREEAARRLAREVDRAVELYGREAHSLLAERLDHVAEAGAQRLEKRLAAISTDLERQREESLLVLERRLGEVEGELRARLQSIATGSEAEYALMDARLQELARRIDQTAARARDRLATLDEPRAR